MRLLVLLAASPGIADAHSGEPIAPHDLWSAWSWDPAVLICLALSAWLYFRGAQARRGIQTWEVACFWAGWLALIVALVSPLHAMGEALFSAHMAQHEVLMVVAAPLLVLGRPMVPFLWNLPMAWRRTAGSWTKSRALNDPLSAWLLHALALWIWHAPALFQATLRSDLVHTLQHVSFLFSALLFWWTLIRGHAGKGVLYVFTTAVHTSILGALLTFAPVVLYPAYSASTAAWGLTPLEDQQLAGLIMWVPAGVVYVVAGLAFFADWMKASALAACLLLVSCSPNAMQVASSMTGGDQHRGKDLIQYYGCPSCHTIAGIPGANGLVGPPLTGLAGRVYVGGMLPNTPENLVRWIRDARSVNPHTAMPNMHVTPDDARNIAAYLETLK